MRKSSLLFVAGMLSFSLGAVRVCLADVTVVVSDGHPAPHPHYVVRDGYYWDGPHAYRRVWVPEHHRYDYRPVHVEHHPDHNHDGHDDHH